MKISIFILTLLVLLTGCIGDLSQIESKRDKQFKDYIGSSKTKAFIIGLNEFEEWLEKEYDSRNRRNNYIQYFKKINSSGIDYYYECSEEVKRIILSSGLLNDFMDTIYYDIFIDTINHSYYRTRINPDSEDVIPIKNKYDSSDNINLIIEREQAELLFNRNGKYYMGLNMFRSDVFINNYLDLKELNTGWISPSIFTCEILNSNQNMDEFIIRAIVFHELCNYVKNTTPNNG